MPPTPHDALFKATFSNPEHAAGELRLILPPALVARIDFDTLTLCPGSYVDEALSERHADLLFSARIAGHDARIFVLFEHQSSVDPLMPLRLLRYMVRIWEGHLKENPESRKLPVIVPVVLHHSDTGWTPETTFEGLLDADTAMLDALDEFVLRFRFALDDLSMHGNDALKGRAMTALGRLALYCLRNARTPDELMRGLEGWIGLVREVRRAPHGTAALAAIWRYIFVINERIGPEEVVERLAGALGKEEEDDIVNALETLIERGRLDGQRKMLRRLLAARFGQLPDALLAKLQSASEAELERWAERVLTASSPGEILAET